MKLSLRSLLIGTSGVAAMVALSLSASAISPAQALVLTAELVLNSQKIQVLHNNFCASDAANLSINFSSFGEGDCDGGPDDAIATGIEVALLGESCETYEYFCDTFADCPPISTFPFDYFVNPFVPHTVNHHTYATFAGKNPVGVGPGTVSAKINLLSVPIGGCGTWSMTLQATGLDLSSITSNPMSIWLNDADGSGPFCYDVGNALIGPPPKQNAGAVDICK